MLKHRQDSSDGRSHRTESGKIQGYDSSWPHERQGSVVAVIVNKGSFSWPDRPGTGLAWGRARDWNQVAASLLHRAIFWNSRLLTRSRSRSPSASSDLPPETTARQPVPGPSPDLSSHVPGYVTDLTRCHFCMTLPQCRIIIHAIFLTDAPGGAPASDPANPAPPAPAPVPKGSAPPKRLVLGADGRLYQV